ncbi:OmpA/MotB family protein [Azospirillum thermophilum]|nr:OmpA family protein [Azospirillum thermophilum]
MARTDGPGPGAGGGGGRGGRPPGLSASDMPPPWQRRPTTSTLPQGDDDQEIWLLSYSDMVTLLFAVFVMLLAITTVKDQLPKTPPPPAQDVPSLPAVEQVPIERDLVPPDPRPRLNPDQVAVESPEALGRRWRDRLTALGVPEGVRVRVQQNRVGIEIGDAILFASGQAELSREGRWLLARLAPLIVATPGDLLVEGHTDSVPIATARFPSNWELSAARAASVVRLLVEAGLPAGRIAAIGYADTRPVSPGSDPASRARNRRVTLSIQAEEPPPAPSPASRATGAGSPP